MFVWNISYCKKNWASNDHKCILVFMLSTHYSCPILMQVEFSRQFFFNAQISNFMKILSVGAEFYADRRTDWHDEANTRFSLKRLKTENLLTKNVVVNPTACFKSRVTSFAHRVSPWLVKHAEISVQYRQFSTATERRGQHTSRTRDTLAEQVKPHVAKWQHFYESHIRGTEIRLH